MLRARASCGPSDLRFGETELDWKPTRADLPHPELEEFSAVLPRAGLKVTRVGHTVSDVEAGYRTEPSQRPDLVLPPRLRLHRLGRYTTCNRVTVKNFTLPV